MKEYRNMITEEFLSKACGGDPATLPIGDLDNHIHPLLHHNKWVYSRVEDDGTKSTQSITSAAYHAMKPALRLVSLLITEPSMLGFFDHLANGIVLSDDAGIYLSEGVHEGTPLGLEYVKAVFEFMSNRTQFVFAATPGLKVTARTTSVPVNESPDLSRLLPGASKALTEIRQNITAGDRTSSRRFRNNLCKIELLRDGWLEYFEKDQERPLHRLNSLLYFASVLAHEIAHAFRDFVRPVAASEEPRFAKHEVTFELGWAYQKWLFGDIYIPLLAKLHPHRLLVHQSNELRWYRKLSEPDKGPTVWKRPPIFKILTGEVVQSWFLKSTWQKLKKGGHAGQIKESGRTTLQYFKDHSLEWYYDGEIRGKLRNTSPVPWAVIAKGVVAAAVGFFIVTRYM